MRWKTKNVNRFLTLRIFNGTGYDFWSKCICSMQSKQIFSQLILFAIFAAKCVWCNKYGDFLKNLIRVPKQKKKTIEKYSKWKLENIDHAINSKFVSFICIKQFNVHSKTPIWFALIRKIYSFICTYYMYITLILLFFSFLFWHDTIHSLNFTASFRHSASSSTVNDWIHYGAQPSLKVAMNAINDTFCGTAVTKIASALPT